ncbi:MAG TPA: asparagine synthase C-terminal domain-containing protein [Candidatus Dojkabacteria bacterium]|nr:asparagine synthase C-terminal domain-containing protein [Candidatus Dojkabacteria bacterium]
MVTIGRVSTISLSDKTVPQLIDEYYSLLSDSVKRMLLGDVEIGLFLSGGIDSSAIAALDYSKSIRTFGVFNDDTLENGDSIFGNKVSNYLGIENHQVNIIYDHKYHTSKYWKNLVWQSETYECGTEQLFKFELYKFIRYSFPNLRVVLLGQGSDEFNGGYAHTYINETNPQRKNMWNEFEARLDQMNEANQFSGYNDGLMKYKDYINKEFINKVSPVKTKRHNWYNFLNMQSKNLQLYQLLHEDRTAMGNSIENRVPFLDHRLIEFILSIPPRHFKELFWNKNILRRAMKHDLNSSFCNRKKVPFIFANKNNYSRKIIYDIFTRNNNELIDYALGERTSKHDVLNRNQIDSLLNKISLDSEYRGIDDLRFLVNMGILSKKLDEVTQSSKHVKEKINLPYQTFCNKNRNQQVEFEHHVRSYAEGNLLNQASENLYLSKNVQILTNMAGGWFIFLDEMLVEIEYEENKLVSNWIYVLRHSIFLKNSVTKAIIDLNMQNYDFSTLISKYLETDIILRREKKSLL